LADLPTAADLVNVALLVFRSPFRVHKQLLDTLPNLRLAIRAGAGADGVDVKELARRGVVLRYVAAAETSVAELAFSLLLASMRDVLHLNESLRNGQWRKYDAAGSEIDGKTLTVVGFGRIGRRVARIGFGFGAHIQLVDRSPNKAEKIAASKLVEARVCDVDQALPTTNILVLCCPLTDQTEKMIDSSAIRRMPRGSYVVNVARGGVLDYDAAERALNDGHLAGLALDVYPHEPPGVLPLLQQRRVVATPHIGAQTDEAMLRIGWGVASIIQQFGNESVADMKN
jgi:D-3-phosphoglycerate dehydrogenase